MAYDLEVVKNCMKYFGLERALMEQLDTEQSQLLPSDPLSLEKDFEAFRDLHEIIYGQSQPFSRTPVAQKYCKKFPPKTSF